jgi:hypothetical protein
MRFAATEPDGRGLERFCFAAFTSPVEASEFFKGTFFCSDFALFGIFLSVFVFFLQQIMLNETSPFQSRPKKKFEKLLYDLTYDELFFFKNFFSWVSVTGFGLQCCQA